VRKVEDRETRDGKAVPETGKLRVSLVLGKIPATDGVSLDLGYLVPQGTPDGRRDGLYEQTGIGTQTGLSGRGASP
jgi:hypothetical protein